MQSLTCNHVQDPRKAFCRPLAMALLLLASSAAGSTPLRSTEPRAAGVPSYDKSRGVAPSGVPSPLPKGFFVVELPFPGVPSCGFGPASVEKCVATLDPSAVFPSVGASAKHALDAITGFHSCEVDWRGTEELIPQGADAPPGGWPLRGAFHVLIHVERAPLEPIVHCSSPRGLHTKLSASLEFSDAGGAGVQVPISGAVLSLDSPSTIGLSFLTDVHSWTEVSRTPAGTLSSPRAMSLRASFANVVTSTLRASRSMRGSVKLMRYTPWLTAHGAATCERLDGGTFQVLTVQMLQHLRAYLARRRFSQQGQAVFAVAALRDLTGEHLGGVLRGVGQQLESRLRGLGLAIVPHTPSEAAGALAPKPARTPEPSAPRAVSDSSLPEYVLSGEVGRLRDGPRKGSYSLALRVVDAVTGDTLWQQILLSPTPP